MTYTAPSILEIGSVRDLTMGLNKVGDNADIYSTIVPLVGSVVPSPGSLRTH